MLKDMGIFRLARRVSRSYETVFNIRFNYFERRMSEVKELYFEFMN